VEQLVLDRRKELPGDIARPVIVDALREEIADLLVEALLRRPDGPDSLEKLVEVVDLSALEPLVRQSKAFDEVLGQHGRRPLAKVNGEGRRHPVPDRKDHLEVIDLDPTPDRSHAFLANPEL